jgi:hypothetical protein
MTSVFNRRNILTGAMQGGAVTLALPLLDCFLDGNGTALANGAPMPIRFGTWFWGLGMCSKVFVPSKTGAGYDLPPEIACLAPVQKHINVFTGYKVETDGRPNFCHYTGWVALRSGEVPANRGDLPAESIDTIIAEQMGGGTRFRSLNATATGDPRDSYSFRGANAYNPHEASVVDLYAQVFGADFQNPNADAFTPSPKIMVQKSVMSAVTDQRQVLDRKLGAADRARLDEYFTGVRQLEQQLAQQLEKPQKMEACAPGRKIDADMPAGLDADIMTQRHKLMTDIMAMALACNQTKVVNMVYSQSGSNAVRKGYEKTHHTTTHEEMVDETLGYQPDTHWFVTRSMENFGYFVAALDKIKEGDGTLLDHSLIYAHSDQEYAKIHSLNGIPMFTAGTAGGKVKTGLHIAGAGAPGTNLGYTVQRVMGVDTNSWGVGSNKATNGIGEILV